MLVEGEANVSEVTVELNKLGGSPSSFIFVHSLQLLLHFPPNSILHLMALHYAETGFFYTTGNLPPFKTNCLKGF